jgi:hypothetical protein
MGCGLIFFYIAALKLWTTPRRLRRNIAERWQPGPSRPARGETKTSSPPTPAITVLAQPRIRTSKPYLGYA